MFKAYEDSKAYPEIHALISYLVNWVAGTKLIFLALLLVIVIIGDNTLKLFASLSLIFTITSFYWRLFPAIKEMDAKGLIAPKGYSKTLGRMIAVFILVFIAALIFQHVMTIR